MNNTRYGRKISDTLYLNNIVVKNCQDKIESWKETMEMEGAGECYSEDGMKDIILDYLDELKIYPNDIDKVMAKLDF